MRKNNPQHTLHGFTLAELLVVMAIIGILFAIALPVLSGISGPAKLDSAAESVHADLKMARQFALANRQPTYLLFHTDQTDAELAYRSYAVFTIDTHSLPVNQASGSYLKDWTRLPEGVVFNADAGTGNENNIFSPPSLSWEGGFHRNRELRVGPDVFTVLGFKPTGLNAITSENDIYLSEGFYENSRLIQTSDQALQIHLDHLGKSHLKSVLLDGDAVEEIER